MSDIIPGRYMCSGYTDRDFIQGKLTEWEWNGKYYSDVLCAHTTNNTLIELSPTSNPRAFMMYLVNKNMTTYAIGTRLVACELKRVIIDTAKIWREVLNA